MSRTVFWMTADPVAVFNILAGAKPAGVRMTFEYSPVAAGEVFTFAPGSSLVTGDLDQGFGDAGDPGVGGQLTGVFSS